MDKIGDRLIWNYLPFTDIPIPGGGVNILTIFNTLVVMAILWTVMWFALRSPGRIPGRGQILLEAFVAAFDDLVSSSLEFPERDANRKFLPLIASLFMFLCLGNFMGFMPTSLFEEPTADINCTLALGFMAIVIATVCGVKSKGAIGYFSELLGPMWSEKDAIGMERVLNKASALFFLPLNVISELSKVISISFRLFGNIIGGSIIIVVVSTLVFNTFIPIGLDLFFVFFVGTVQAFVFTMLTLTYISVAIK
ncbi:MAG: FoF1 ATP synthase subunit a [Candidatus Hydrogenedentota bacterium]